jgi:hypothetical protein
LSKKIYRTLAPGVASAKEERKGRKDFKFILFAFFAVQ